MGAGQLEREDVAAFLDGRPGGAADLEPLTGGAWSSAWAYRAAGEELVVRFGREVSWYETDRMAMAFAGPDLPVPQVREVGTTPSGWAYAISVRHHGRFLEDTPAEQAGAIAPTLTRLLVALYHVPAGPDTPVTWHPAGVPIGSWRDYLLAGLVDDPGKPVHGWSAALAADRELAALSAAACERVRALADACPERRDLVHGDLLHGNVLVSPDARRVEAVLSWKCSVRGDFLFDAAWCSFWAPFHPGIAAVGPLSGLLQAPGIRAEPGALVDAAVRHHCYELHIGFTHLGWNVWTRNQAALAATARRLADVLERGPLPLAECTDKGPGRIVGMGGTVCGRGEGLWPSRRLRSPLYCASCVLRPGSLRRNWRKRREYARGPSATWNAGWLYHPSGKRSGGWLMRSTCPARTEHSSKRSRGAVPSLLPPKLPTRLWWPPVHCPATWPHSPDASRNCRSLSAPPSAWRHRPAW